MDWKYKLVDGRNTKLPHTIKGRLASSTDEKSWSTLKEVKDLEKNLGIIFTPEKRLLGIDIDHCINKKTKNIEHEEKEKIADILLEADTYTEISPSGEGLHLFLALSDELSLEANRHANFECYTSGRYFTVTGESYHKKAKDVREVTPEEALEILSVIGYPWGKENKNSQDILHTSEIQSKNALLSDQDLLNKIFSSKNGKEIKALYDGDISGYQNDNSSADLALCSYFAFWTNKNATQIESLWLASPLGQREKTQTRKDYRSRTIGQAIASCKDVYVPHKEADKTDYEELDLLYFLNREKEKVYIQNTENMCRIFRNHPDFKDRLRYDLFKNVLEINSFNRLKQKREWRNFEDNDEVNLQTSIQILFAYFSKVPKLMIRDAMIKVAKENIMDSAVDYMKSLVWDKEARLDNWLTKVYGVPDDVYHKAVASNWMKGLVKRIIEPGCKFDYVLVLEGEQGSKKSTSLSVLGQDWHVETTMSTESKDFFMQFQGKSIIEFSEGETLSRTEVKRMKAIITMQVDKFRPPYERTSQDFPRRCVFAMTTNQTEYLKDETGNRRWLPVAVVFPEADVEWLKENRDQLFAEAFHRVFNDRETIYEFPKDETTAAQNQRRIHEPNADLVAHWYHTKVGDDKRTAGITSFEVYRDALNGGFTSKPMNRYDEMSISEILKGIGLEKRRESEAGLRLTKWYWPENLPLIHNEIKEDPLDADWNPPPKNEKNQTKNLR